MANRDQIPARMLPVVEESRLQRWAEIDGCKNFPDCTGDGETCNTGCDKEQTYGDGGQWGAL